MAHWFRRTSSTLNNGRAMIQLEIPVSKEPSDADRRMFASVPEDDMKDYREGGMLIIEIPGVCDANSDEEARAASTSAYACKRLGSARTPAERGMWIATLRYFENLMFELSSSQVAGPKVAQPA